MSCYCKVVCDSKGIRGKSLWGVGVAGALYWYCFGASSSNIFKLFIQESKPGEHYFSSLLGTTLM